MLPETRASTTQAETTVVADFSFLSRGGMQSNSLRRLASLRSLAGLEARAQVIRQDGKATKLDLRLQQSGFQYIVVKDGVTLTVEHTRDGRAADMIDTGKRRPPIKATRIRVVSHLAEENVCLWHLADISDQAVDVSF